MALASVRSNQKLDCVSEDVKLPEQTVGLTNVRPSILQRSGRRSPRAHLEIKYTKNAERLMNLSSNILGIIQGVPKHHRNSNPHTRCGQGMVAGKQLGTGPKSCTEFSEHTWRTMLHSSNQKWIVEQHTFQPSIQTFFKLLFLVLLCI